MDISPTELQRNYSPLNAALIGKFLDYRRMQGASKNTVLAYSQTLRSFAHFLGSKSILTVEHSGLLAYLSALYDRGRKKKSVYRDVCAFHAFQKFLSLIELPCSPAMRKLRAPKLPQRIGEFHSLNEVEALIAAARPGFERALVEMFFATLCRISEVAGMRAEQINWENRTLKVLGKGNKERIVFFGQPAEKALRALLRGRTEGFLFRDRVHPQTLHVRKAKPNKLIETLYWRSGWSEYPDGQRVVRNAWLGKISETTRAAAMRRLRELTKGAILTPPDHRPSVRNLAQIIVAIGKRAGLATHPHKLRHSGATAMLNHGAGIREIQELMGHASISTTVLYLHSSISDLMTVHRKFHPREAEK